MKINDKVVLQIKKSLEINKKITSATELNSLIEWDSMGALTFIGMADAKYKKIVTGNDLVKCKTIQDLINLPINK